MVTDPPTLPPCASGITDTREGKIKTEISKYNDILICTTSPLLSQFMVPLDKIHYNLSKNSAS